MNIKEAKGKKITWEWEKVSLHRSVVIYSVRNWDISISRQNRWCKIDRKNRVITTVIIKNNFTGKILDISNRYGNTFTNINQIKKYVEYCL